MLAYIVGALGLCFLTHYGSALLLAIAAGDVVAMPTMLTDMLLDCGHWPGDKRSWGLLCAIQLSSWTTVTGVPWRGTSLSGSVTKSLYAMPREFLASRSHDVSLS